MSKKNKDTKNKVSKKKTVKTADSETVKDEEYYDDSIYRLKRLLIIEGIVFALVVTVYIVLLSFTVTNVYVEGNQHYDAAEIRRIVENSWYGYKSIDDAIASVTKIAQGQNNQIVDKSAKTKWGGNKFEGIIYKKEFVSGYPTYYEVVCTQIGDYCLKITLSASSDSDLSVLRSYFN